MFQSVKIYTHSGFTMRISHISERERERERERKIEREIDGYRERESEKTKGERRDISTDR